MYPLVSPAVDTILVEFQFPDYWTMGQDMMRLIRGVSFCISMRCSVLL